MIRIKDSDGREVSAATAAELVSELHADSRSQAATDADWMQQTAERVLTQTGTPIASNDPVAFITGLIELGLIELVEADADIVKPQEKEKGDGPQEKV